jgi:aprataxin
VHLLLLPRKKDYQRAHPLKLLSTNTSLLATIRSRIPHLKALAASELRRQFGHLSAADAPYQFALEDLMSSPDPPSLENLPADMPKGRDYLSEIKVGVHTHPSMNHLHIHIFSRDMHSAHLKHRKHYNSFTTSFLVELEEFPLEEGSARFSPGDWPGWEMKCWRCGEGFGNKFARLKEHVEGEFGEWVKE